MENIASLFEFYKNLKNSTSKDIFEIIKYFQNNPKSAVFFLEEDFERPFQDNKNLFYKKKKNICFILERIAKANYARENKLAFEKLEEIPSIIKGHEHCFVKIGEFYFKKEEYKDWYSEIYECVDKKCKLQSHGCPHCGYVPFYNLTDIIVNKMSKKGKDARYDCNICGTELGEEFSPVNNLLRKK